MTRISFVAVFGSRPSMPSVVQCSFHRSAHMLSPLHPLLTAFCRCFVVRASARAIASAFSRAPPPT